MLNALEKRSAVESFCESTVTEAELEASSVSFVVFAELRQRNVNGGTDEERREEMASTRQITDGP